MWGEKFPDKQSSPGLDLVLSKQHFIFSNTCGGEIIGNKRVFYIKTLKLSKTEYTGGENVLGRAIRAIRAIIAAYLGLSMMPGSNASLSSGKYKV